MEFSYSSKLKKLKNLISHLVGNASCMTQQELKLSKETCGCTLCMNNLVLIFKILKGSNRFVTMIFKFLQRDLHDTCVVCRLSLQQVENVLFCINTVGMYRKKFCRQLQSRPDIKVTIAKSKALF